MTYACAPLGTTIYEPGGERSHVVRSFQFACPRRKTVVLGGLRAHEWQIANVAEDGGARRFEVAAALGGA